MFKLTRRLLPLSGTAAAALAWRHRNEIADWLGFAFRSARGTVEGRVVPDDVKAESRLRMAILKEHRLRGGDQFDVVVRDGIARFSGRVDRATRDTALRIAGDTPGIRDVDTARLAVR